MGTIAGVKMANMSKPKESLTKPGKLSPDPYSYEHRISLDQDALSKMKVAGTPKVGDIFHVMGEGHIVHVHESSDPAGSTLHVGVQLKKMGMKPKSGAPKSALDAVSKGIKDAG